jgi:hypothetical protein
MTMWETHPARMEKTRMWKIWRTGPLRGQIIGKADITKADLKDVIC